MKKQIVMAVIVVLMLVAAAWASFTCPIHPASECYSTGQVRFINGQQFEQYRCNPCGDVYWQK